MRVRVRVGAAVVAQSGRSWVRLQRRAGLDLSALAAGFSGAASFGAGRAHRCQSLPPPRQCSADRYAAVAPGSNARAGGCSGRGEGGRGVVAQCARACSARALQIPLRLWNRAIQFTAAPLLHFAAGRHVGQRPPAAPRWAQRDGAAGRQIYTVTPPAHAAAPIQSTAGRYVGGCSAGIRGVGRRVIEKS